MSNTFRFQLLKCNVRRFGFLIVNEETLGFKLSVGQKEAFEDVSLGSGEL